jgi:hypothetical protein
MYFTKIQNPMRYSMPIQIFETSIKDPNTNLIFNILSIPIQAISIDKVEDVEKNLDYVPTEMYFSNSGHIPPAVISEVLGFGFLGDMNLKTTKAEGGISLHHIITSFLYLEKGLLQDPIEFQNFIGLTNHYNDKNYLENEEHLKIERFSTYLAYTPLIPTRESPIRGVSLAEKAAELAYKFYNIPLGAYIGVVSAPQGWNPILLITVPSGIILCAAAGAFAKVIHEKRGVLFDKILGPSTTKSHRLTTTENPKPKQIEGSASTLEERTPPAEQ